MAAALRRGMLTTRDRHLLIATFVFSICFLVACAVVAPRYMVHLVRMPVVVTAPVVEAPVVVAAPVAPPPVIAPIARRVHKVVRHDAKPPTSTIGDCNGDPLCHVLD